jgi:hypothetical protein
LQVLSGKVPFYQIRSEAKIGAAITARKTPVRPSQEGNSGEDIKDAIWRPVSSCWEFDTKDRLSCLQFQSIFSSTTVNDDRHIAKPSIRTGDFGHLKNIVLNVDIAGSILTRIVGPDLSKAPSSQIPEHLQNPVFGLVDNIAKAESVAAAATKLSSGDTQILADMLDLVGFSLFLFV